jgi:hypothetical protein
MRQLLFLFLFLPLIVQAEKKLLWGDTHLHTYYSPDAYLNQNQSIGPDTAYRFAKGWPVTHPSTQEKVQLNTPLDFLVIADHAESMGVIKASIEKTIPRDNLSFTEKIKVYFIERLFFYLNNNPKGLQLLFKYTTDDTTDVVEGAKSTVGLVVPNGELIEQSTWQSITDAAEEHYESGIFTSLIGWEWTSIPAGANLHRVIFTNSDAKVAQSYQPFSSALSNYPEDLWQWLENTAQITGADFIAIPHNSNISRGFMFPSNKRLRDTAIDIDWINQRAKWETAVEITQVKGDSEIDPLLSPDDEFADFEAFPHYLKEGVADYTPTKGDFIRPALLTGLKLDKQYGRNPYAFGLIGSTDSHTGLATADEGYFWGKMASDSALTDKQKTVSGIEKFGWAMSASGLAAVWAEDNNRSAIFNAFKRKEVYATTGSRIQVRVFAGKEYLPGDESRLTMQQAAELGVPMGSELGQQSSAPRFIIYAMKDPRGAHLDRVQIIKGWLTDNGEAQEKIYNVAWSGDRKLNAQEKLEAVVNTVDLSTGEYTNDYGASALATVWQDPDFNPQQRAFYYVRVLEIPTPRHSTRDAIQLNQAVETTLQAATIQERAYTSPIWYQP